MKTTLEIISDLTAQRPHTHLAFDAPACTRAIVEAADRLEELQAEVEALKARIDDGSRPHRMPRQKDGSPLDEVWAWRCQECGDWIDEARSSETPCPIDWRRPK